MNSPEHDQEESKQGGWVEGVVEGRGERDDNSLASDVVASTASHAASPDCYTVLPYRTDKRTGKVQSSLSLSLSLSLVLH